MKILVIAAALLLAGPAHAQSPPAQAVPAPPVSTLTRDLNSGPPAPAVYLAPAPAPVIAAPPPAPASTPAVAIMPAPPVARAAPPSAVLPPPSAPPVVATPPRTVPIPVVPAPGPRTAPIPPPPVIAPSPTPPPAPAPAVTPPPPAPAVTVLDIAARAALPFTADLPPGFEIVTGRPGPDFRIYTIRRGPQSFVMVYAGPASQFPIYTGQMVEAGGRASILSSEDGVRHAVEHLFQRAAAPSEIHIWTMSLDGADRDLAEQIAQSVDVR